MLPPHPHPITWGALPKMAWRASAPPGDPGLCLLCLFFEGKVMAGGS